MDSRDEMTTFRGVVYSSYLDHMGHMNVQYYVHLFDQATWILFDQAGLSRSYFSETGRGMAAMEQHITYRREVFAGTVITITTRVLTVADKTVRFLHTMHDPQGIVSTSEILAAHFDRTAHKAAPFPQEARTAFLLLKTGGEP